LRERLIQRIEAGLRSEHWTVLVSAREPKKPAWKSGNLLVFQRPFWHFRCF